MIHVPVLTQELLSAGIIFSGINDQGIVWGPDGTSEIQTRPDVNAIVDAHIANAYDVDELGNLKNQPIIFENPIQAPSGLFGDVFVASPKKEKTHDLALSKSEEEANKVGPKSIARIALNLAGVYLPELERRAKKGKI